MDKTYSDIKISLGFLIRDMTLGTKADYYWLLKGKVEEMNVSNKGRMVKTEESRKGLQKQEN